MQLEFRAAELSLQSFDLVFVRGFVLSDELVLELVAQTSELFAHFYGHFEEAATVLADDGVAFARDGILV